MWAFGKTVTQHRQSGYTSDADGNDVPTFTDVTVENVAVYPLEGSEVVDMGGDLTKQYRRIVRTPPFEASHLDEFSIDGTRWKVCRPVSDYDSPLTGTNLTSLLIERIDG